MDEKQPAPPEHDSQKARKPESVAIRRLMDEVKLDQPTPHGTFNRAHNRHNRS
jgi:hypothetical protein